MKLFFISLFAFLSLSHIICGGFIKASEVEDQLLENDIIYVLRGDQWDRYQYGDQYDLDQTTQEALLEMQLM